MKDDLFLSFKMAEVPTTTTIIFHKESCTEVIKEANFLFKV